jgi:hypothetical protein
VLILKAIRMRSAAESRRVWVSAIEFGMCVHLFMQWKIHSESTERRWVKCTVVSPFGGRGAWKLMVRSII